MMESQLPQDLQIANQNMRDVVRSEIENVVLAVIKSVVAGKKPSLEHLKVVKGVQNVHLQQSVSQQGNTQQENGENATPSEAVELKQTVVKFSHTRSRRKFALLLHLMSKIYSMIQKNQKCTKRDLYYENVTLYETQQRLENGLQDLCLILRVPRDALCVEATSKGLIAGNVSFKNASGEMINVSNFRSGMLIPSCIDELQEFQGNAQFIIVVEKDAIFQRLIGENIFSTLGPMILVTGKGYPDFATLKLIRKLASALNLSVFALVDCDPHGIEIASILRWGSYGQANIARCLNDMTTVELMTVPQIVWLGLLPSEIRNFSLPLNTSAVMTERDTKKLQSVEQRILAYGDAAWIKEVQILKEMNVKAELEALFSFPRFATEVYLKKKLENYFKSERAF